MKSSALSLIFISFAAALAVPLDLSPTRAELAGREPTPADVTPTHGAKRDVALAPGLSGSDPVSFHHPPARATTPTPRAEIATRLAVDPVAVLNSLIQSDSVNITELSTQLQTQLQNISTLSASEALATLEQLLSSAAIKVDALPAAVQSELQSVAGLTGLAIKRENLPLLNCDYPAATHCALYTAGQLQQCMWQAIGGARAAKTDPICIAAAEAMGSSLPADCRVCLGL